MRDFILTNRPSRAGSPWLTSADTARILRVTPRAVRWFAQTKQLACLQARSGVRFFQLCEVLRFDRQRAEGRAQTREAQLAAVRPRMLRARLEPRQPRLRLTVGS